MRARGLFPAICATGVLLILSCGGSQTPSGASTIEKCLPAKLPELGLVRDGEILNFAGDSLFDYIDGAAEMYHKYDFVEVHVGKYRKDGGQVTVDIYRFAADDLAFGMYSTLRPDEPDAVALGAEGFTFGPVLVFAKPPYMVNVQTYDEAVFASSDIEALAAAVNENLPGSQKKPETFDLFPDAGRIPHSEKIVAEAFLGRGFLTDVYTVNYSLEGGEAALFLAHDEGAEKFGRWSDVAAHEEGDTGLPPGLPYDEGMAALLKERYYGGVIAGIVSGRLAGIVGYMPAHEPMLRQWLESLPAAAR